MALTPTEAEAEQALCDARHRVFQDVIDRYNLMVLELNDLKMQLSGRIYQQSLSARAEQAERLFEELQQLKTQVNALAGLLGHEAPWPWNDSPSTSS